MNLLEILINDTLTLLKAVWAYVKMVAKMTLIVLFALLVFSPFIIAEHFFKGITTTLITLLGLGTIIFVILISIQLYVTSVWKRLKK